MLQYAKQKFAWALCRKITSSNKDRNKILLSSINHNFYEDISGKWNNFIVQQASPEEPFLSVLIYLKIRNTQFRAYCMPIMEQIRILVLNAPPIEFCITSSETVVLSYIK